MRYFFKNRNGRNKRREKAMNIQEWVICLWPYLCSIGIERKENILPKADLGVSISGSKLAKPAQANEAYVGSMPKLVRINSVNRTENVM
jgi:hypothetical protein